MTVWLWVALGGAIGAITRFGLQSGMMAITPGFPAGTAIANLLGCFCAGLVYTLLPDASGPSRALVLTGFLGALTTLSSFSLEVVLQLEDGKALFSLAHWIGGAFISILLCYAGLKLGAWLTA